MNERIASEVHVPQLGEGLREARIVQLSQSAGTSVLRGDPLYLIETDKTTVELEAPYTGRLIRWLVGVGDVVEIGAPVALIASTSDAATPHPVDRLIPPRTRAYARQHGIEDDELPHIPAASGKLMPNDIDTFLRSEAARDEAAAGFRERKAASGQRALIYRLRRSASLVIPGTVSIDIPWRFLNRRIQASASPDPSPAQVFAHAVAMTARSHPNFRSIMLGDDRIREYEHTNVGMAIGLPDDELIVVVVRHADRMSLEEFSRACRRQMRIALRSGDQAADDTQILISHLGKSHIIDAVPTLVAPASSVFFLGVPGRDGEYARIALTFDHRLINGGGAAKFLANLVESLQASYDGDSSG